MALYHASVSTLTIVLVNSPPTAKPCMTRMITNRTGAAMPAYTHTKRRVVHTHSQPQKAFVYQWGSTQQGRYQKWLLDVESIQTLGSACKAACLMSIYMHERHKMGHQYLMNYCGDWNPCTASTVHTAL